MEKKNEKMKTLKVRIQRRISLMLAILVISICIPSGIVNGSNYKYGTLGFSDENSKGVSYY